MSAHPGEAFVAFAELEGGRISSRFLGHDEHGMPIEALVLRDREGVVRAYRNLCRHLPVPLDGGSRAFVDATGAHLLCGTHGALYRREDGLCIGGPCEGETLFALVVEQASGGVLVRVAARGSSTRG